MNMTVLNKIMTPVKRMAQPLVRPVENVSAIALSDLANTSYLQRFANWSAKDSSKYNLLNKQLSNFDAKVLPVMSAVLPIWISSFYVTSNLMSKEIPKERKIPLLINDVIICAFSTLAGFTVVKLFKTMEAGMNERLKELLLKTCKDQATYDKKIKMYSKGLKQMMFIAAFTLVFRFLGPVIATPMADKVNKFLISKGIIDDPSIDKSVKNGQILGQNLDISTVINNTQSLAFKSMLKNYVQTHLCNFSKTS